MFKFSRLPYYLYSFIQLLFASQPSTLWEFFRNLVFLSDAKRIKLRKLNLSFKLKTLLDLLILKEVILDEEYEQHGVKIDGQDKIIVDIGAGFGDFSILTAKKFPQAKIFAFEPDPFYFNLLRDNIRLNKVGNIIAHKKAITSLRQISHLISSPRIDFIKIDCEGCEFEIFSDENIDYLKKVKKISMEYHESERHKAEELISMLEKSGFRVRLFYRRKVENIGILIAINDET